MPSFLHFKSKYYYAYIINKIVEIIERFNTQHIGFVLNIENIKLNSGYIDFITPRLSLHKLFESMNINSSLQKSQSLSQNSNVMEFHRSSINNNNNNDNLSYNKNTTEIRNSSMHTCDCNEISVNKGNYDKTIINVNKNQSIGTNLLNYFSERRKVLTCSLIPLQNYMSQKEQYQQTKNEYIEEDSSCDYEFETCNFLMFLNKLQLFNDCNLKKNIASNYTGDTNKEDIIIDNLTTYKSQNRNLYLDKLQENSTTNSLNPIQAETNQFSKKERKSSIIKPFKKEDILLQEECEVDYGDTLDLKITKKEIKERKTRILFQKQTNEKANKELLNNAEKAVISGTYCEEREKKIAFQFEKKFKYNM